MSLNGYASFDGMCWPLAGERLAEVEWRLRYGDSMGCPPTREDQLLAASVLSAYRQMIHDPESKRRRVIRALREMAARAAGKEGE